jgi:hypothetical protein
MHFHNHRERDKRERTHEVERNVMTKAEETHISDNLFGRMQDMNRAWLQKLRELRQAEAEFAVRLLAAKTPSEAAIICHEWIAMRLENVTGEQQAFTTNWLEFIADTMKSASNAVAVPSTQARKKAS